MNVNLRGAFLSSRVAVCANFFGTASSRNLGGGWQGHLFISLVHELIPWAGHLNYAASKGRIDAADEKLGAVGRGIAHTGEHLVGSTIYVDGGMNLYPGFETGG